MAAGAVTAVTAVVPAVAGVVTRATGVVAGPAMSAGAAGRGYAVGDCEDGWDFADAAGGDGCDDHCVRLDGVAVA